MIPPQVAAWGRAVAPAAPRWQWPPSENRLAQRIEVRKNFLSDCAGKIILDPAAILRYDWSITTKKDA
jgi:hypothetical protein